jgi:hypothetical protein
MPAGPRRSENDRRDGAANALMEDAVRHGSGLTQGMDKSGN